MNCTFLYYKLHQRNTMPSISVLASTYGRKRRCKWCVCQFDNSSRTSRKGNDFWRCCNCICSISQKKVIRISYQSKGAVWDARRLFCIYKERSRLANTQTLIATSLYMAIFSLLLFSHKIFSFLILIPTIYSSLSLLRIRCIIFIRRKSFSFCRASSSGKP